VVAGTGTSSAGGTGAPAAERGRPPRVGVLAVQGAFAAHRAVLVRLRAEAVEVRTPADLAAVEALVLPGGESTTISMLLGFNGLTEPLREAVVKRGMPTLGTCAGMIVLARTILDGRDDQVALDAVDISVRRNAFGRQVDSFETDLEVEDLEGGPFPAVFIRAPVVEGVGPGVEVLATVDGRPVLCRQGAVLVAAFHPELSGDDRIHRLLLDEVARQRAHDHAGHRQLGCQNRPAHPAGGSGPIAR
jgi:5'-phosphate synthase pdxT subunit